MGFIALKCPACGADIQLDDNREFGFCQYCGTKVVQDKQIIEHRGSIKIDHSHEIKNYLTRANEFMRNGDISNAERYYNRVLDLDVDNKTAREGINRLNKIIVKPNIRFRFNAGSGYNRNVECFVWIDNGQKYSIQHGGNLVLTLPVGRHIIGFGSNTLNRQFFAIEVVDRNSKFDYNFGIKFGGVINISPNVTFVNKDGSKISKGKRAALALLITFIVLCVFITIVGVIAVSVDDSSEAFIHLPEFSNTAVNFLMNLIE